MDSDKKRYLNLYLEIAGCSKLKGMEMRVMDTSLEEGTIVSRGGGTLNFENFNKLYCLGKSKCKRNCLEKLKEEYRRLLKQYKIK